jgi:hypothetical protein
MSREQQSNERGKRGASISGVQVMFAAILSIGLILAINFGARITASQPLQEAYHRARNEINALTEQQATLTALRDYVRSDAYVERWAREDGKMIREGEVLVIPVPSGSSLEPTPAPQVRIDEVQTAPDAPETWTVWWQLFFDSPPPSAR